MHSAYMHLTCASWCDSSNSSTWVWNSLASVSQSETIYAALVSVQAKHEEEWVHIHGKDHLHEPWSQAQYSVSRGGAEKLQEITL